MQKQLKDKFPEWCKDSQQGKYNLYMSNDMDSLLSCLYLKWIKGYEITRFYDFHNIYETQHNVKEFIGVDMALEQGKVWDNHITKLHRTDTVNPESANVNSVKGIDRSDYFTKYAGSTLLQIISYYNIPLPKSRDGKLILLAIDSSYLGYYNKDFKARNRYWLEQLELFELIDLMDSEPTINEFKRVKRQYNLGAQITVDENGILQTDINLAAMQGLFEFPLSLSADKFSMTHTFNTTGCYQFKNGEDNSKHEINELYSIALTHRDKFKWTSGCMAIN